MRITDERFDRDLRRYQLAWRMLQHAARRNTVMAWTGLSLYRVQSLAQTYNAGGDYARHRGPSPYRAKFFSKSIAHECESAALAYIGLQMDVIPALVPVDSLDSFTSLARGERLVDAFDLYQTLVPQTRFSLEFTVLLVTELAQRKVLTLSHCEWCGGLMVIERLGTPQRRCGFCRLRLSRAPRRLPPTIHTAATSADPDWVASPPLMLRVAEPESVGDGGG